MILRPMLLSERAVNALVRTTIGERSGDRLSEALWNASGGNPLYLTELLRAALELNDPQLVETQPRPSCWLAVSRASVAE